MDATDPAIAALSKNVRAERLRRGVSQKQLAKMTGLSVKYISRLETTPQNVRVDKLCTIAKALGVGPGSLLERDAASNKPTAVAVARAIAEAIRLLESAHARVS
jgi:transcriptional regulator with XRE-family HTH domain